jgi:hypothetical protein
MMRGNLGGIQFAGTRREAEIHARAFVRGNPGEVVMVYQAISRFGEVK